MSATAEREGFRRERRQAPEKVGVVVLGTGRSGTSAIARAFVFGGFHAGRRQDLCQAHPSNPLGHYEHLSILSLNEELLAGFGCGWWADAPVAVEQLARGPEILPQLRKALAAVLDAAEGLPVILKEPRINPLLPLWHPILDGALHPVLAVRDPLEIAASLARRDGTPLHHGLAAWEVHMALVLDHYHGEEVTVAPYPAVAANCSLAESVVAGASSHLTAATSEAVRPEQAAAAFRLELRHERADSSHEEQLTAHQLRLWEYLGSLPPGNSRLEVPFEQRGASAAARAAVRKEGETASLGQRLEAQRAGLLQAQWRIAALERQVEDALGKERRAADALAVAEAELDHLKHEVNASLSWKLTVPLRAARQIVTSKGRVGPSGSGPPEPEPRTLQVAASP